jgi:Fic family protein
MFNDNSNLAKFSYFPIKLCNPSFDSNLVKIIFEIERITNRPEGNFLIFYELREILFDIEMIYSVRIEGNNTTIGEFLDNKPEKNAEENFLGIVNLKELMNKIILAKSGDKDRSYFAKTEAGILELHKNVVKNLSIPPKGDGDPNPGEYKKTDNQIGNSRHLPAMHELVPKLMTELLTFFNNKDEARYDYLKIAQFHHYFTWIHPFFNGNGRVARLITFAQLAEISTNHFNFVNPAMIFGQDKQLYYDFLAKADEGTEQGVLAWCEYFLGGVLRQFEKNQKLTDEKFLNSKILFPALEWMRKRGKEKDRIIDLLKFIIQNEYQIKSEDLNKFFGESKSTVFRSRTIKSLLNKKYLQKDSQNSRLYNLSLENLVFRKAIIYELAENDIIDKIFQNEL